MRTTILFANAPLLLLPAELAVPVRTDGLLFLAETSAGHSRLWYWMIAFSVTAYVVTLVLLPVIACVIPENYFQRSRPVRLFAQHHPALALALNLIKNLLGGCFVICGIAMIILPGPGLISILLGLVMLDFPGKLAAEVWFLRRTGAIKAVNWIRSKWHRPPLKMPKE